VSSIGRIPPLSVPADPVTGHHRMRVIGREKTSFHDAIA
jgi:hypothetical protein